MVRIAAVAGDDWTLSVADLKEYIVGGRMTDSVQRVVDPRRWKLGVDDRWCGVTHRSVLRRTRSWKLLLREPR